MEIGAEVAQIPEKEYINGIAVAVWDKILPFSHDLFICFLNPHVSMRPYPCGVQSSDDIIINYCFYYFKPVDVIYHRRHFPSLIHRVLYFPSVPWRGRREDKEKKVGPHFSLPGEGWWGGVGRGEPPQKLPQIWGRGFLPATFCHGESDQRGQREAANHVWRLRDGPPKKGG